MHFNHYGGEAARLAAALANGGEPWEPHELEPVLDAHGIADRRLTAAQVRQVWEWSRRLGACFGAQPLDLRCERINALLADSASRPYISLHDGTPHLHYSSEGADPAAHIRAVTAAGLSYVACFASPDRLGRCAREECDRVYVDVSRNGRRAYCTLRCSNTDAVRRHRAHHRKPSARP
ncbi:CGNR zinc finger domain-containing protein [Streptomyces sp. NPDC057654]|uniref:CGNR zinc finger domain-containing protein n=1 Tax=Streptomyces sp. NPDC057654 TaxID=3346196 RepID=UPI00369B8A22